MSHLQIFYFSVSSLVGFMAAALLAVIALRENNRKVRYFLWTFLCFTVMVITKLVIFYSAFNINSHLTPEILVVFVISSLAGIWVWYFLLQLFHAGAMLPGAKVLNRIVLAICVFLSVILFTPFTLQYYPATGKVVLKTGVFVENIVNLVFLVYSVGVGTRILVTRWKEKTVEASHFRTGLITMFCCTPLVLADFIQDIVLNRLNPVLVEVPDRVIFFPFFYIVAAVGSFGFCIRELSVKPAVPARMDAVASVETLTRDFSLTEREREMIPLVLEGIGNKEMASRLGIAVKTVNNHLYGLYRKLGINTRFELIGLVSRISSGG